MILDILRILSVVTAFYCMCLSVRVGIVERIVGKSNNLSVLVFVSAALYLVANIMYEAGGIKVDNFISILYRQDFIIVFFAFLGFQKRRLKELKGLPIIAYEYRGKITSGKQN
tara:strand:- start:72 stop:410 length:339 start_codon:yes stop_codon:yes gene_type:complete